jgi:hypothetical protein
MLIMKRVGFFLLGFVLAASIVFGIVVAVNRRIGSELHESIRRVIMFVTASVFILQIISQATRALRSSAPPMLQSMFKALEILQLSGIAPPPECLTKAHPFQEYLINFAICLFLLLINISASITCTMACCVRSAKIDRASEDAATTGRHKTLCPFVRFFLRRVTFILLSLLYALTVNNTFAMLNCKAEYISVSRYTELDQNGITLARAGIREKDRSSLRLCELDPRGQDCEALLSWSQTHLTVRILNANPSFVCYEGAHLDVVWFAYITLLCYVIGYPVGSYVYLRRRIRAIMLHGSDAGDWTAALAADRERRLRYIQDAPNAVVRAIRCLRAIVFQTGSRYQGRVRGFPGACTASCCFLGSRPHAVAISGEKDCDGLTKHSEPFRTAADIVDENVDIRNDIAISPFAADVYRASIFYQRHIDFMCLFVLSVLLVFFQDFPQLQLGLSLAVLTLHTVSVLLGRPYTAEASFNHVVRVCANMLAMMGAIASFLSSKQTRSQGPSKATSRALVPFSYVMLVLCIGLALLFIASFFFTLVNGAKLDHEEGVKQKQSRRILVSPLSVGEIAPTGIVQQRVLFQQVPTCIAQVRETRVHNMGDIDWRVKASPMRGHGILGFGAVEAAWAEARAKPAAQGKRIIVPDNVLPGQGSSRPGKARVGQHGLDSDDWDIQGLEARANPLFITTEVAGCPPHMTAHGVSDW